MTKWRKSSHSIDATYCVEVADLTNGGRMVRDSKNPGGAILTFSAEEWHAFTLGMIAGEFA